MKFTQREEEDKDIRLRWTHVDGGGGLLHVDVH